jgi:hypothetical protein
LLQTPRHDSNLFGWALTGSEAFAAVHYRGSDKFMEYRCVAEDRVLRSVEIDFAVNVQALAPPAEKATVRQDQAGQASTRNGGRHSDAVSKPNNPDPVTELRAKRLALACPFRLRPELQPPRAGENCEQVLTHQLKLLAFLPVVAGPGVAGFVRPVGCFDPATSPAVCPKTCTWLDDFKSLKID